jgi:Gly-Xaa carboxypeptidase
MDSWLRNNIKEAVNSKKAARAVADHLSSIDIFQRYLMQTSQAIDVISGGVKINALPEKVHALVNHRIAVESEPSDVRANLISVISSTILPNYPFSLDAWGEVSGNTSSSSAGKITLSDLHPPLHSAPVSPTDTDAFKTFSGTIKQIYGNDLVVAPSLMTGNTDTRYYWGLSRNIYRFGPLYESDRANEHTVDERLTLNAHIMGVKFYTQLVLNQDL